MPEPKQAPDKTAIIIGLVICALFFSLFIPKKHMVTKSEFGEKWPFSIDKIEIKCMEDAAYVVDKDIIYPLNGLAISKFKGRTNVKDVSEIQLYDDKANEILEKVSNGQPYTKIRKDLSPILNKALEQCK